MVGHGYRQMRHIVIRIRSVNKRGKSFQSYLLFSIEELVFFVDISSTYCLHTTSTIIFFG